MIRQAVPRTAIALALFAAPAAAQTLPTAGAELLKPLQFLVGRWSAEAEFPGAGKAAVERTYRLEFGGKFLYQTEVARFAGGIVTREMWLGLDPATQALGAWAFSSDGSLALLSGKESNGETLILVGRLIGGGDSGLYRSTIQRHGNDRYTHTIESQKDGVWAPYAALNFTRAVAGAPATAAAPLTSAPHTKALEPLAGNWRAEGESEGTKYAVDYAMYWTLAGHFLRSDYSVTTNAQTEFHAASYMFFDPEGKSLRQFGFSADGSVGSMKISPQGEALVFEGELITPTRRAPMRMTYTRTGAETLACTTEMQRQGAWRRTGTVAFSRRP